MLKFNCLNFMSFLLLQVLVLSLILLSEPVQAQTDNKETVSPDEIDGAIKVDADGLIREVNSIENLVLIDSRIKRDRKQGYIEGSISLPDENTNCQTLSNYLKNKTRPMLFYCNGPKCGRSVTAVKKAISCGYKKIYWFRGGIEEWSRKGFPLIKDK